MVVQQICFIKIIYYKHLISIIINIRIKPIYINYLSTDELLLFCSNICQYITNYNRSTIDWNIITKITNQSLNKDISVNEYHNIWRYLAYGIENKCEDENIESDNEMISGRLRIPGSNPFENILTDVNINSRNPTFNSNIIPTSLKTIIPNDENKINDMIENILNENSKDTEKQPYTVQHLLHNILDIQSKNLNLNPPTIDV